MCNNCNYSELIEASGLKATANRIKLLELVGNHDTPVTASEIYSTLKEKLPINRVTVYRILDIFVDSGLLEKLSTSGRQSFYGLAPNEFHERHAHFYCMKCGELKCLHPSDFQFATIGRGIGRVGNAEKIEVRIDGVCNKCLEKERRS